MSNQATACFSGMSLFTTGILQENGQCDILLLNTLDQKFPAEVMLQDQTIPVLIPANSFLTLHVIP